MLLMPLKPFNKLRSTTLFSSVGIIRVLSFFSNIALSILLGWTWGVWTLRRWTKRWRRTRLLNPQLLLLKGML